MIECYFAGKTISQALSIGRKFLQTARIGETPYLDAEVLLCKVSGLSRTQLYVHPEKRLQPCDMQLYQFLLEKRSQGVPVAYLIGEKEFMSMKFEVTCDCLIPRSETEILVEKAIERIRQKKFKKPHILDLGTGSGCIAISIAFFLSECKVIATDISHSALQVALKNAEMHKLMDRITFLEGDLYNPVLGLENPIFDVILSNPPYIAREDEKDLPPGVRDFEPQCALLADEEGLSTTKKIIEGSLDYFSHDGFIGIEINPRNCEKVRSILISNGFIKIDVFYDLGGFPRAILAERPG